MHGAHSHGGHSHAGHAHGFDRKGNAKRMWIALAINAAMVVLAIVGAAITGSLALLADAGHVLSDVLAILLGIVAAKVAQRPAHGRGTFGLGRVEILAALVNGIALVAISVFIAIEAIGRFSDPPELSGAGILIFGAFGLLGNVLATLVLISGDRTDINLEGVMRHSLADALGSFGVIVAGVGIMITGWNELDAIVGLLIAVLILASSWRVIREPVDVLLERAPQGLDVEQIGRAIAAVNGVREVHDLHIWSITSGFPALAAHVTTSATCDANETRRAIEQMLERDYELSRTTLQVVAEELLQIDE